MMQMLKRRSNNRQHLIQLMLIIKLYLTQLSPKRHRALKLVKKETILIKGKLRETKN